MKEIRSVAMTGAEMRRCTEDIVKAMNDAQSVKGFTIDQVLMACGYMLGAGIRQRGGVLSLDAPLRRAFPPLVAGYEAAEKLPVGQPFPSDGGGR
jgi:hypothetical protein